jgi:hypothetical protein
MSTVVGLVALMLLARPAAAQTELADQIRALPSAAQAEALGAKLLRQCRAPAAAVAAEWQGSDPAVRHNARIVLNEMEEAALAPLLDAKNDLPPDEQVWRLAMVVETLADLRRSAAAMLDRQLRNTQPAPLPSVIGAEESDHDRRVCDEAYVQMSRLLAAEPDSEAFVLRMREFTRMPVARRDAEIERARRSAAWRTLVK